MTKHNPEQEDSRVDAVLHALARTEPDDTFQARLITALHTTHTNRDATPSWTASSAEAHHSFWKFAVAACLLMLVGLAFHHVGLHRRPGMLAAAAYPGTKGQLSQPAPATVAPYDAAWQTKGHVAPGPASFSAATAASAATAGVSQVAIVPAPGGQTHRHAAATDSLPPPPLPMTEQERLLLRLSRSEPTEQLAQLTRPAQDAMMQRDKDAVTEFFAPAPPLRGQQESPSESGEPAGQP